MSMLENIHYFLYEVCNTVICLSISDKKVRPNSPDKGFGTKFGPMDWSFMDNSCIIVRNDT